MLVYNYKNIYGRPPSIRVFPLDKPYGQEAQSRLVSDSNQSELTKFRGEL